MSLDKLLDIKTDNFNRAMELVDMKDRRLTYQEARIDSLEREVNRLNIEILNLESRIDTLELEVNRLNIEILNLEAKLFYHESRS